MQYERGDDMGIFDSLNISATALTSQRLRLDLISSNLANVNTTRTSDGGPYQRKDVIFKSQPVSFESVLDDVLSEQTPGVAIDRIYNDPKPFMMRYEPNHPDANSSGYVTYPNINVIEEMVNMISASRSFEANTTAIETAKSMALRAIELGR
jgi:flagellar basal-body rod protein FlgC